MTVLDASAALAYLQNEPGGDVVHEALSDAVIGAANLTEVLTRMGGIVERSLAEAILIAGGVRIEPVTAEDARIAAELHGSTPSLSLGDRLCLALGRRRQETVLTADSAWGSSANIVQIR